MRRSILLLLTSFLLTPASSQDLSDVVADSLTRPQVFPWSAMSFDRLQIRNNPARTLEGLMTLSPGVTKVSTLPRVGMMGAYYSYQNINGTFGSSSSSTVHSRGSREGEMEYRFGGISVLNRWTNENGVLFIPEMLENVTVHTGAYGPELGSMGGGVIDMKLREGGETFSLEASFLTDDVAKPGERFLNTSSYGWTTAVVPIGTPLPFGTKIFVAGEISRQANLQPMYHEPINAVLAPDAIPYNSTYYGTVPGPFVIERNHIPMQSAERNALQWNFTSSLFGFDATLIGSISSGRKRDVTWPTAVTNYYRQQRLPWTEENATLISLKVSRALAEEFEVHGSVSYQGSRAHTADPDFGEAWRQYPDSAANASKGYSGFTSRYQGPLPYSAIFGFLFGSSSSPNNAYARQTSEVWRWSAGIDLGSPDHWSGSIVGGAEWWTLRTFAVTSIASGLRFFDSDGDGISDWMYPSALEQRVWTKRASGIRNFGYDFQGDEVDDGPEGPRHPSVMSLSASSAWHDDAFTINIGLRAVWLDMDMTTVPKQLNPATDQNDWQNLDAIWDYNLAYFREERLTRSETESYALPRISVQHATPAGRVYAAYGSFVESSPYRFLQLDDLTLATLLDPLRRVGYNLGGPAITFLVQAARTEQLECGAEYQLVGSLRGRASVYHKSMSQQVQIGRVRNTSDVPISVAYDNTGESAVTGVEAALELKPTPAFSAGLTYAWASMQGYGSFPRSNQYYVMDEYSLDANSLPKVLRPLTYERSHRFIGSLDIDPREGWFDGLHLYAAATLESGTPYTQIEPINNMGSASVWNIGVRPLIDIRTSSPLEPLNSSRTPWVLTVDLSASYDVVIGPATVTLFALVNNLFDRKNVLNVYPNSGTPSDDTWLQSPFASWYASIPQYFEFYRLINLQNRWAYMSATGNDIYGTPRQIRMGAKVAI